MEPWWISLLKAAVIINVVLLMFAYLTWVERKQSAIMQDRIGAAGGVVDVVSEPGRGTRVIGRVPISRPKAHRPPGEASGPDGRSVELGHRDGLRPRPAGPALEGVLDHERL